MVYPVFLAFLSLQTLIKCLRSIQIWDSCSWLESLITLRAVSWHKVVCLVFAGAPPFDSCHLGSITASLGGQQHCEVHVCLALSQPTESRACRTASFSATVLIAPPQFVRSGHLEMTYSAALETRKPFARQWHGTEHTTYDFIIEAN